MVYATNFTKERERVGRLRRRHRIQIHAIVYDYFERVERFFFFLGELVVGVRTHLLYPLARGCPVSQTVIIVDTCKSIRYIRTEVFRHRIIHSVGRPVYESELCRATYIILRICGQLDSVSHIASYCRFMVARALHPLVEHLFMRFSAYARS